MHRIYGSPIYLIELLVFLVAVCMCMYESGFRVRTRSAKLSLNKNVYLPLFLTIVRMMYEFWNNRIR